MPQTRPLDTLPLASLPHFTVSVLYMSRYPTCLPGQSQVRPSCHALLLPSIFCFYFYFLFCFPSRCFRLPVCPFGARWNKQANGRCTCHFRHLALLLPSIGRLPRSWSGAHSTTVSPNPRPAAANTLPPTPTCGLLLSIGNRLLQHHVAARLQRPVLSEHLIIPEKKAYLESHSVRHNQLPRPVLRLFPPCLPACWLPYTTTESALGSDSDSGSAFANLSRPGPPLIGSDPAAASIH